MEGQQISVHTTCQNDKCLKPLSFKHTSYGKVHLKCPKCLIKQVFVIEPGANPGEGVAVPMGIVKVGAMPQTMQMPVPQAPANNFGTEANRVGAPANNAGTPANSVGTHGSCVQREQTPAQQPIQQPAQQAPVQQAPVQQPIQQPLPQQAMPAEERLIELPEEIVVGKQTMITCPHCGCQSSVTMKQEGKGKMKCKNCGGLIGFTAKSKTIVYSGNFPMGNGGARMKRGRLVKVNGFFSKNDVFKLCDGKNVIGRFDHSQQSDIAITGDGLMSRRSVEIEATVERGAYVYKFTILKCTNPVIYNKQECRPPFSREIRFGDVFILGKTTFRFEADE